MDSSDHVLDTLGFFDSKGLTISNFLQVLLSSWQYADHPMVVDLVQSCSHIISLLCSKGTLEGPALQWMYGWAEKLYQNMIQELGQDEWLAVQHTAVETPFHYTL